MEPEPDPTDLAALDPTRDRAHVDRMTAAIVARATEIRRFRRAIVRRGAVAMTLAAAAALALWLVWLGPRPAPPPPDLLTWALHDDASPDDILAIGAGDAR